MRKLALLRTILGFGVLAIMAGCAEVPAPSTTSAVVPPPQGYWNGDGVSGAPKIVVSISEQRAYFFKGKRLVGQSTVSTGKPGFGTPPGQYTVVWKDKEHVSTVFGDYVDDSGNVVKSNIDSRKDSRPPGSHYDGARMPFAMFFRGGYAMHQGYVPPYAASHGCIRLPAGMAEPFFNNAPLGTPVLVKEGAVEYVSRDQPDQIPPFGPAPVSPPAPNVVRSTAPAPVPPASFRSNVPAPVRSPAPLVLRAPATVPPPVPVRSPSPLPLRYRSPAPLRSPSPAPVRSPAPVVLRAPATVPSPTPVRSSMTGPVRTPSPAPLRSSSPAPVRNPSPVPLRSPAPVPLRSPSPAPVRSTTSTLSRKPAPVPSPTPIPRRSRRPAHLPAPTPTPTPRPPWSQ